MEGKIQEADFVLDDPTADVGVDPSADKSKPMKFVPAIEVTDDMDDGQKAFAATFNEMRELLLSARLMKAK